jgi:hypothetical protein
MARTLLPALLFSLVVLCPLPCSARPDKVGPGLEVPRDGFEFDAHLTGRGERMNYGPVLACSLISARREPGKAKGKKKAPPRIDPGLRRGQEPPIVLRALAIHLGGRYWAAFDTELLAFAAAWSGGAPDISQTNLNGYKGNDLAYLRLPALFQNALVPGWSAAGDFADPRPGGLGALPKNVAHYKGLYLHGWEAVLSYTVGASNVLERPSMLKDGKTEAFCRTIRVDRAGVARHLFVCDLPGASGAVEAGDVARLERKDTVLRVGVTGAPAGRGRASGA